MITLVNVIGGKKVYFHYGLEFTGKNLRDTKTCIDRKGS